MLNFIKKLKKRNCRSHFIIWTWRSGTSNPGHRSHRSNQLCYSGTSTVWLATECTVADRQMEASWLNGPTGWMAALTWVCILACSTAVKNTLSLSCELVKQELSRVIWYDTTGEAFPVDMPLTPSSPCVVWSGLEPYWALAVFPQGSSQTSTLMILGWAWTPWLSKSALVWCT